MKALALVLVLVLVSAGAYIYMNPGGFAEDGCRSYEKNARSKLAKLEAEDKNAEAAVLTVNIMTMSMTCDLIDQSCDKSSENFNQNTCNAALNTFNARQSDWKALGQ